MADGKKPLYEMADGSYPINNCADVSDAAKLAHHSKTYSFDQVKAHVLKAKAALKCPDSVLPDTWNSGGDSMNSAPPREGLIRGVFPMELRDSGGGGMPILCGHFAVFDRWTEIDSVWEGQFMESIAPGAFKKTIAESQKNMRCLFQHGKDPAIGDKVLGPIVDLREDEHGAYYEVQMLDTSYNRDLLPGLEAGLYGASFRFSVMKEALNQRPERSDWNPGQLPQRTVQETKLREFGPVTWPAYADATASIRSLTDDYIIRQVLAGDQERLQALLNQPTRPALSRPGAGETHSEGGEPQSSRWPSVSREEFIRGKTGTERSPFGW